MVRHRIRPLVAGNARGPVLFLDEPLSFWGGVDPATGVISESRHPQAGQSVRGTVLAVTHGRGSSSASSVLAEMIRLGTAPATIVVTDPDHMIVIGSLVAAELYGKVMPVFQAARDTLFGLAQAARAEIGSDGDLTFH